MNNMENKKVIKKSPIVMGIFYFLMIGLLIFNIVWLYHKRHPNIKAGQVWVKEYNLDNPYKKIERDTIRVLEVKNDYALYVRGHDTISDRCIWIPINARLIEIKNKK